MIKLLLIVRYKFGYMVPNNRAGTPEVISPFWHFILVLLGPSVLTSTQWVSDRVRTSPRDTTLSIVSLLQLSPFLGQFPLGLMSMGHLGLPLLFFWAASSSHSCHAMWARVACVAAFSLSHCSFLSWTSHRCTLSSVLLFFLVDLEVASA